MISLVLATLLVGSTAEPSLIDSLSDSIQNTLTAEINNTVTAVTTVTNSTTQDKVLTVVTSEVKSDVGAVTGTVESVVLVTATSQCELVKTLLGVDYTNSSATSLKYDDLQQLTIDFIITPSSRITYNLSEAAELIPKSSYFNSTLPVIIISHGFLSNPDTESVTALAEALLNKGEYNVLALDSSAYLYWFYLRATTYVRYIGERLGEVLTAMVENNLDPTLIHLIGHSLGAHICGFTGKRFTQLTGERVGRITGLDPAGPCFFNVSSDLKLNATDADYVDAIHTAAGTFGINVPVGQSDFFPNGGAEQPDCVEETCSHSRVWDLYTESVENTEAFLAVKCSGGWDGFRENNCEQNTTVMGYGTTSDVQGIYYLQTASTSPYGLGTEGTNYTNTEGLLKSLQSF